MSKIEKLFTVAGTATNADGTTKVRFANDLVSRVKILQKNGCTNINLVTLPNGMTKLQALQYLQELGVTQGQAGEAVSTRLMEKISVAKATVSVTAAKPKSVRASKPAAAPSMESIKAKAARKAAEVTPVSTPDTVA